MLRISDTVVIVLLQPLLPGGAILTGLAILLSVCVLLYFLVAHSCDIRVHQAAKGISADYDALVDCLGLVKQFIKYLNVYIKVIPTPPTDDMVAMIIVELLAILSMVTKGLMLGQLSASALSDLLPYFMQRSEPRKDASRRTRHRGNPTEARSARPGGSSDDCIANSRGDLRPRSEYEGCYGW